MPETQLVDPPASGANPAKNWDSFRYFLAVARAGSISGAAKLLNESQPTVGRKIREMEKCFSAQLVERGSSGICLTESGLKVLNHVENIERETKSISESILGLDECLHGKVVVAVPEGFGFAVLVPKLADFRKQYPDIDIELLLGAPKVNLVNHDADIALRIGDPVHPSLVGRKIGDVAFSLYAHASYVETHGVPQSCCELDNHLLIDSASDLLVVVQSARLAAMAPNARRVVRTNSVSAQVRAVCGGIGIGALPRYVGAIDPSLIEILPGELNSSQDLWILMHRDMAKIARIKAVNTFLIGVSKQALAL